MHKSPIIVDCRTCNSGRATTYASRLVIALSLYLAGALAGRMADAQQAFFKGLGELPGGGVFSEATDISADGTVVVGLSKSPLITEPFRWTAQTGMVGLGFSEAGGGGRVSADGSTILGQANVVGSNPYPHYKWTTTGGMTLLPSVIASSVYALSGDGSTFVGATPYFYPWTAMRWTEANGIQQLPLAHLGPTAAHDISADGSVILFSQYFDAQRSTTQWWIWSDAQGATQLGVADGVVPSLAHISDDGKVVFGGHPSSPYGAWRWTKESGVTNLGPMPDGTATFEAEGASADGSIMVGSTVFDLTRAYVVPDSSHWIGTRPFIWDAVHGPRYLFDVLATDYGLGNSLAGWRDIARIGGISADGRTITGLGINSEGKGEAWIAYLGIPVPEPTSVAGLLSAVALIQVAARNARGRGLNRTHIALKSPPI